MVDLRREEPIKPEDVAEIFGVCRRTVENWFRRGLEHVHVGRLVFTSKEALQRFGKHSGPSDESQGSKRQLSSERKAAVKAAKKRHRV